MAHRLTLTRTIPVLDSTNNIAKAKQSTICMLSQCCFERAALENHGNMPRRISVGKISPKLKESIVCRAEVRGSQLAANIPVLDLPKFAGLKPGSSSWLAGCGDVRDVLEEHSFFVGSCDKYTPKLKDDVYCAIKEVFDLPTEKKQDYNSLKSGFGYFLNPNNPLLESMIAINTADGKTAEDFITYMFPPVGNEQFSKSLDFYANLVAELLDMIVRMVFESYGVEKYFDSHKESSTNAFRMNKYRAPSGNENNLGAAGHTDQTFFTVISSSQSQGLEVKGKDGNWIPVYIPPSTFVILAGDVIEAWSNGRIRSCMHQVTMNASREARYSISTFFVIFGTVAAPKELVDDAHPLLYKPFRQVDLLEYSATEDGCGLNGSERLRTFRGNN